MYYTVIQSSGYRESPWKVSGTFGSKSEAREHVNLNAQTNARYDWYNTKIKSHRKDIFELADIERGVVRFSDGTEAWVDWL